MKSCELLYLCLCEPDLVKQTHKLRTALRNGVPQNIKRFVTDDTGFAEQLAFCGTLCKDNNTEPTIQGSFERNRVLKHNRTVLQWIYSNLELNMTATDILTFWVIAYVRDKAYASCIYEYAHRRGVVRTFKLPGLNPWFLKSGNICQT